MKMKVKLIITITFLIIMTIASTGVLVYETSYKNATEQLEALTGSQLEKAQIYVDKYFDNYGKGLMLLGQPENVLSTTGKELDQVKIHNTLDTYLETYPSIKYIYFASEAKDFYIEPHTELPDGYDPTQRPWYLSAKENKSLTWTDTYIDAFTGEALVSAALPIYDEANLLLGVLSMDLNIEDLFNEIQSTKVGDVGYVAITDTSGVILSHPNSEAIGRSVPIMELQTFFDNNYEGMTEYSWKGVDKVAFIRNIESRNWKIIAFIDKEYSLSHLNVLLAKLTILSIILFILSLLAASLLARKIDLDKSHSTKNEMYDPFSY